MYILVDDSMPIWKILPLKQEKAIWNRLAKKGKKKKRVELMRNERFIGGN